MPEMSLKDQIRLANEARKRKNDDKKFPSIFNKEDADKKEFDKLFSKGISEEETANLRRESAKRVPAEDQSAFGTIKERLYKTPEEKAAVADFLKKPVETQAKDTEDSAPDNSTPQDSNPSPQPSDSDTPPPRSTDGELKKLENRLSKYEEELQKLPPENKEFFQKRLDDAKLELQNKDSELERGELVEKLSQAVTQLGAGLYGLKTGTDLSGLKFNLTDWDKKYQRSLDKYKLNLSTIAEDRQREDQERYRAEQSKGQALDRLSRAVQYRRGEERARDQLNEMIRHNKALEKAAQLKAEKGDPKAVSRLQARVDKLTKGVVDVYRNEKLDEDEKASMAETLMANAGLNISPEDAKNAVTEPGWLWGRNAKDPSEAMSAFSTLIQNRAYTNYLEDAEDGVVANNPPPAPAGPATVERVTKDGRTAIFDARTKQFLKYKD